MSTLSITGYDFNDPEQLPPGDRDDFAVWMTVTLGDEQGGSNFQIHVCSPASISGISDKRGCFVLEEWRGEDDLIKKLNAFALAELKKRPVEDPYHALARHWLWEYAGMK